MAGDLLFLSYEYLGAVVRRRAKRGFRASAVGSGVPAGSGAASTPLAARSGTLAGAVSRRVASIGVGNPLCPRELARVRVGRWRSAGSSRSRVGA